jgi:hypothetical protein
MNMQFRWLAGAALFLWAAFAQANFHLFALDQLYSNQTGEIEFIVVHEYQNRNDQQVLSGSQFASLFSAASHGHATGDVTTYLVPNDLASNQTAGKRFLLSSQGFADLGIITPDYVFPNRFMASAAGTLSLYADLAAFRSHHLSRAAAGLAATRYTATEARQNMAINFAGQTASVPATPAASPRGQAVEYYYADWDNAIS